MIVLYELVAKRKILLSPFPTIVIVAPNHGKAKEEKLLRWDIGAIET